jgi:phosphoglycolate phosphatase
MKYKLIIFDFDGTLADTFPWFLTIADMVAEKFNLKPLDQNNLDKLRLLDARQLIKHQGISLWKLSKIARFVSQTLTRDIHKVNLFEGMENLINQLAQAGIRLVVVSSNSCENVKMVLGPQNASLFSGFECGVSMFGKHGKFKKIIKEFGLLSADVISIGDEIRDIQAAKKARIPFGAVAWGYTDIKALLDFSPDEVFFNIEEIFEKIGT